MENIDHAHIVSLMYKLITTAKGCDDLSIGFDPDQSRRQRELTNNKNIKGKYHVRIYLKDIFGFAEHQEKATYGLGYKLALTRNSDSVVLNKANAVNEAKIIFKAISWHVPHYTPSVKQETILMNQIVEKLPTDLQYIERSVFMKQVSNQKEWIFELGVGESMNIPIWVIIGFQQQDRKDSKNLNNDTFC